MRKFIWLAGVMAFAGLFIFGNGPAHAIPDCTFTTVGTTNYLDADCTTDETIFVPNGSTLNGQGYAITAVDPVGGHFVRAVVENDGTEAHVVRLVVNTSELDNICDAGNVIPDNRLRGILFDGASGSITHNTVQNINQGASGCQEGNAIEVRNAPLDGTHPNTQSVEIAHNVVEDYQKGGIICNGDVDCWIRYNFVGDSATQQNLAANSVQLGYGAAGTIEYNHISGNQWLGASDFAATAILLYLADPASMRRNNVGGNSDVGIYVFGENIAVDNNRVFDGGDDGNQHNYDYGIGNWGSNNEVTNNKVRGFDTPVDGDTVGTRVVPSPSDNEICFGTDCDGA